MSWPNYSIMFSFIEKGKEKMTLFLPYHQMRPMLYKKQSSKRDKLSEMGKKSKIQAESSNTIGKKNNSLHPNKTHEPY